MAGQELQISQVRQCINAQEKTFSAINSNMDFVKEAGFAYQIITANSFMLNTALKDTAAFANAIKNIALTNLTLNPKLEQAYLIPRKGKITLEISYKGLISVLSKFQVVKSIFADIRYEKDFWQMERGTNPFIKHIPSDEIDRGKILGAYAVAHMKNNDMQFEYMNLPELENIMKRSEAVKAGNGSPYDTDKNQMFKKTVIKRLCNYLPKTDMTPEIQEAISLDNDNVDINFKDEQAQKTKDKNSKLLENNIEDITDTELTEQEKQDILESERKKAKKENDKV